MNIFFDLDGTLLDSRLRLYLLFQHLVPESALSFEDYWDKKRNKISHRHILKNQFSYSEEQFKIFEKLWLEQIELPEWLAHDQPFEGITAFLLDLKKEHKLYIVTARQFEVVAQEQVQQAGWADIFDGILVTCQKQEKCDLISNNVKISGGDWIVGDTGKDIQTGKQLGIRTAAVLSGFMNREKLSEYQSDVIVDSVLELNHIFNIQSL